MIKGKVEGFFIMGECLKITQSAITPKDNQQTRNNGKNRRTV